MASSVAPVVAMATHKSNCNNCTSRLGVVWIRCCSCPPSLDLCLSCFASGAELGSHMAWHSFMLMDRASFIILSNWRAREQLSLLDAVEQYGYGNWSDVSKRINNDSSQLVDNTTEKKDQEAENEFNTTFLQGILGTTCWHEEMRSQTLDHTPNVSSNENGKSNSSGNSSNSTAHLVLGYMGLRDDFEVEHANDAERLVSHLQPFSHSANSISSDDDEGQREDRELEVALQIAHVEIYRDKLKERHGYRKANREHNLIARFVKEHPGVLEGSLSLATPSTKTKKQHKRLAEVERLLKTLSRFQSSVDEHSATVASVQRERELRNRLRELIRYRKHGIKSLRDAVDFDYQRVKRSKKQRQQQQQLLCSTNDGSSTIKFVDLASAAVANSPSFSIGDASSPTTDSEGPNVTTFTLSQRPSFDLLSPHEQRLCTSLRLTPSHYITYKTCLLTNHLQKKKGQTPKPLNPAGLDKSNRKVIFQYLMRSGWISAY